MRPISFTARRPPPRRIIAQQKEAALRDARIAIDLELLSEAEQLRKIWGASLGTARRNEKARQQRLKDERAIRRRQSTPKPRRYPDPT